MATYDYKQVLADYAIGKITPEMAVGHSLQHIEKLYEAQTAANVHRYALEKRLNTFQTAIDRLTAFMEKMLSKRKQNPPGEQPRR